MKKHDQRFEKMRFQARRKYILKGLDLKSKTIIDVVSEEESKLVNGR